MNNLKFRSMIIFSYFCLFIAEKFEKMINYIKNHKIKMLIFGLILSLFPSCARMIEVTCVSISDVRYTIPKGTLATYIMVDQAGKHYQITDQNLKYKVKKSYKIKLKKLK